MRVFVLAIVLSAALPGSSFQSSDERDVLAVIQRMFDTMRAKDSAGMAELFLPDARLVGIRFSQSGRAVLQSFLARQYAGVPATDRRGEWIEKSFNPKVMVAETMATVWLEYDFYLGTQFSHCGVDAFQLVKVPREGWRIAAVADTFQRENCPRRSGR